MPGKTILKTYRLEGNYVHRIVAPGTPTGGEAHPEPVSEKKKDAKAAAKHQEALASTPHSSGIEAADRLYHRVLFIFT